MTHSLVGRLAVSLCLLGSAAEAQFQNLVVDGSATNVWFSSPLRLRADAGASTPLIYQAGSTGPRVFLEPTDPDGVVSVRMNQASDSGDVVCWTVRRLFQYSLTTTRAQPQFGLPIMVTLESVVHRYSDGKEWTFSGEAALSRNGRWVWTLDTAFDLQTGQTYDMTPAFRISSDVSDEGDAIVVRGNSTAGLLRPGGGQFRTLPGSVQPGAQFIRMDRHASTLVWSSAGIWPDGRPLMKLDVATGALTTLVAACVDCQPLHLSGDGRRVVMTTQSLDDTAGVWLMDTLSLERTDLTAGAAADATLTSSGQTVCYSGNEGMLQCRDLETGDTHVVVERTAQVSRWPDTPDPSPAPGSRYTLSGWGLAGAKVFVNGAPATVAASSDTSITLLVPEDAAPGDGQFSFDHEASPFRSALSHEIKAMAPRVIKLSEIVGAEAVGWLPFLENGTVGGLAGEFRPLHPGEAVWIHMVGLGRDPSLMRWYWKDWLGGPEHDIVPLEITKDDGWYTVKVRIPETAPAGISAVIGRSPWDPLIGATAEIPVVQ
ncbi:hypothetical protein [uncultured Paludibaculum sp.]|uniref:hypothetical protein n=1 Tax=uncultured Paludibaculum sp. TaxID=1765020 RepID=UPI002AAC2599|nr:hypothetical protein [uncultured Paludibaculum sp.]